MVCQVILRRGGRPSARGAVLAVCLASLAWAAPARAGSDAIRAALADPAAVALPADDLATVRRFYALRADAPAWTETPERTSDAAVLRHALADADEDGLDPDDYAAGPSRGPAGEAEADIRLSDDALRYARDLRDGRAALRSLERDVELPAQTFDAASALADALAHGTLREFLASLAPPHAAYGTLKAALARYRAIAAAGDWPQLALRRLDAFDHPGPAQDALRRRLAFEDDAVGDAWQAALARFQVHHGLAGDGRAGAQTLAALNVSAAERALTIEANLERWRWLPRRFEPRYVAVNVPAQELAVVQDDEIVLTSRVVVGRPRDPTPILRAVATGVTVNPPWNVPAAIARREILPALRRHHDYLAEHDMILRDGPPGDPQGLDIDWRRIPAGAFPYRVQQLPGDKNALGTVKLELPNRFDVYLHDTPAKVVFTRTARDVSHGCVRVEQIRPLAAYALTGDPGSVSSVDSAVAAGTTETIPLATPLPIYLLYWTAFVDADGATEFRPDIYGRDRRLIDALTHGARNVGVTEAEVGCRPV